MGEAVYQRSPGAISREVDGEVLIVPELHEVEELDDVLYYLRDAVSLRVWELLGAERSLAELTAQVTAEFEIDAQTARGDLERFLTKLVASGAATLRP